MDVREIVGLVKQMPQVQKAVDIIEAQLARAPIMPEDIDEIIGMLEAVVEDPNRYPEVRAAAIRDGVISEQEAPQEYDPTFVLAVLVALYEYRDRLSTQGYARGGLKVAARKLAAAGRGGDSMLAHINPREAEMLRRMGGSGTVNPMTGLTEYKSGKGLLGAVLPIALSFIAPGLGTAIGAALGATGTAATMLGSAVIGGLSAGLTGGNPLQGAVLGGLGGGLGGSVGSAANNALGLGLGSTGQQLLGGAIVGGASGALTGQGVAKGALMGAAGAGLGAAGASLGGEGALGAALRSGTSTAGNMLAAGYKPREALVGGALSGAASGFTYKPATPPTGTGLKPSEAAVNELKVGKGTDTIAPRLGTVNYLTGEQGVVPGQMPQFGSTTQPTPGIGEYGLGVQPPGGALQTAGQTGGSPLSSLSLGNIGLKDAAALAALSGLTSQRPPEINEAIQKMSPQQQEYFNRPSIQWDWNKLQSDANAMNMSLSDYMASYWPQVTSGAYNVGAPTQKMFMGGYAGGGALGSLMRGGGSGRDDTINARLSDGEYVMDAETVAMLGDGSTDEGARRLDGMRAQLRKHKGKALSRGKFSPNAKSPLAYLKGAA